MSKHTRSRFIVNVLAILMLTLLAATPSFAQDSGPQFEVKSVSSESIVSVGKATTATSVSVIVKLKGASLASYAGDIAGLAPTSPSVTGETQLNVESAASQAYLAHLTRQQAAFEAAALKAVPQAKVTYRYIVVLNGVAMIVPADQVDELAALPDVEAVYPDTVLHPHTDKSPAVHRRDGHVDQLGGQESSGDNVVVGVIDTGIWPEHPLLLRSRSFGQGVRHRLRPRFPAPAHCQFSGGVKSRPRVHVQQQADRRVSLHDHL